MSRQMIDPSIIVEVANALYVVEEKLDAAIQEAAQFTAQLIDARLRAGVSVYICQGALESTSGAVAVLTQARRELVKAHTHLREDQLRLGMRNVMIGPGRTRRRRLQAAASRQRRRT
jgi:hypothetical protein